MPQRDEWGPSQILYEVTSSGVGQKPRVDEYPNAARVRLRSCDKRGNNKFFNECKFPFLWKNELYDTCITDQLKNGEGGDGRPWCFYKTRSNHEPRLTKWGYCLPEEKELVPRSNQFINGLTCGDNYHRVCGSGSENIYGGLSVDWENGEITLSIYTPKEVDNHPASSIKIPFTPEWMKMRTQKQDYNL